MPSVVYSGLNPPICFHPLVQVIINLHVACHEMPLSTLVSQFTRQLDKQVNAYE